MFSVNLFVDGQARSLEFTKKSNALCVFLRTYYRLRQVKRGVASLRYDERPVLIFSGKDNELKRLEDI